IGHGLAGPLEVCTHLLSVRHCPLMHSDSRCGLRSAGHGHRPPLSAHFGIVCLLSAVLVVGGATQANALDGKISISQYAQATWTTDQSLPQNTVYSIVQTGDGYLWLGTWEGVAR